MQIKTITTRIREQLKKNYSSGAYVRATRYVCIDKLTLERQTPVVVTASKRMASVYVNDTFHSASHGRIKCSNSNGIASVCRVRECVARSSMVR